MAGKSYTIAFKAANKPRRLVSYLDKIEVGEVVKLPKQCLIEQQKPFSPIRLAVSLRTDLVNSAELYRLADFTKRN